MDAAAARPDRRRVEFGDWQTPRDLADRVFHVVRTMLPTAGAVLEPTCGSGVFLAAAHTVYPGALLRGFEISAIHAARARSALPAHACILTRDFFRVDWDEVVGGLPDPILIIGNPPWVTSAALGSIRASNQPARSNFKHQIGLQALTGKSNFDISETMLLRLLASVQGRDFFLAMLCKTTVARRVMEHAAMKHWRVHGSTHAIDARIHFAAAVDAALLVVRPGAVRPWPVFPSLDAPVPVRHMGMIGGRVCGDVDAGFHTRGLQGCSEIEWRSGIKHDCAAVMELGRSDGVLVDRAGAPVRLESGYVYPLLKGSDVANRRLAMNRSVIVTQRFLGQDTAPIGRRAPATWRYLRAHGARLDARRSRIYRGQPRFAMFGVGDYSFARWKVAICGMYKRLAFTVVAPIGGRPVMLDDTCYFLPCRTRRQATLLARALNGPHATAFLQARVFWDAKRPINKELLQTLSLRALLRAEGRTEPDLIKPDAGGQRRTA